MPGLVAMATNREGTIYEGAFGARSLGQPGPMTLDTVGWIASMTKALTSVTAVQLVERGQLNLDAPATSMAPAIAQAQVLTGFDAAGQPLARPPKRPIALRHLLTHSAGFSYEIWNTDIQKAQAALGIPGVTECKNKALTTPLLFDPGERWEYGINIEWAAKMVEAVTGRKLGAVMQDNLLGPLGMSSTAFKISAAMRQRLGGERVLKPETVASLGLNRMGSNRVRNLKAAIGLTNDAEFFPGVNKSWSLAFQINHDQAPTGRPAGGLMWAGLANSYHWIDPASGVGGVFMTQILPFADTEALPLYDGFETAVYDALR